MPNHSLLDRLDSSLGGLIPSEPVELAGEWTRTARRTSASEPKTTGGSGQLVDVIDLRWRGTLTARDPMGAIAFLADVGTVYWAKAPDISPTLPVEISLHAYADYRIDRASFTGRIAGAYLPGIPVPIHRDLTGICRVDDGVVSTGRVARLARADAAGVFVLLFPRRSIKVGRKRLWHLRDELASSLPPDLRALLTRRRSGRVPGTA